MEARSGSGTGVPDQGAQSLAAAAGLDDGSTPWRPGGAGAGGRGPEHGAGCAPGCEHGVPLQQLRCLTAASSTEASRPRTGHRQDPWCGQARASSNRLVQVSKRDLALPESSIRLPGWTTWGTCPKVGAHTRRTNAGPWASRPTWSSPSPPSSPTQCRLRPSTGWFPGQRRPPPRVQPACVHAEPWARDAHRGALQMADQLQLPLVQARVQPQYGGRHARLVVHVHVDSHLS